MKNRKCPNKYACFGYDEGSCDTCDIGILINKLSKRINRLKKKLEKAEKPTADAVEVVRCKDCKYLYCLSAIDRRFYCRHYPQGLHGINVVEDNPYCSYGERRENGK